MEAKAIKINVAPDVQVFCDLFGITPEQLLDQYMLDLCSMAGNGGSDERYMAKAYFLRTYLASMNGFTMAYGTEICEEFELLYQNAYPSTCNSTWADDRAEMLQELHEQWKQNLKNFQSSLATSK